jgi:lysyl-tRNA synthetase class 2
MTAAWRPSATLENLQARAGLLARLRAFFADRQVLEVETPLLVQSTVTDPHIDSWSVEGTAYLHTSPEYAMKRLLAAGFGPIYQIAKVFRKGERGSRHNPEFSLLEWYRPGFDHWAMMDEVADLLAHVLGQQQVVHISYRDAFMEVLGIDPHRIELAELIATTRKLIDVQLDSRQRDDWLNLLLSHLIEPQLGRSAPTFLYNYPASQAALAQISRDENGNAVAERFELYIHGLEIANGYRELLDVAEQKRRFEADLHYRQQAGMPCPQVDQHLLAALEFGLPECAGVALGLDRLLMLQLAASRIDDVISFPFERA